MGINYKNLGGASNKKPIYTEGDEYKHPSGSIYKRINGNWVLIQYPDGSIPQNFSN